MLLKVGRSHKEELNFMRKIRYILFGKGFPYCHSLVKLFEYRLLADRRLHSRSRVCLARIAGRQKLVLVGSNRGRLRW